jgi:hypothetical protein
VSDQRYKSERRYRAELLGVRGPAPGYPPEPYRHRSESAVTFYWVVVGLAAELGLAIGARFLLRRGRLYGEDVYWVATQDQADCRAARAAVEPGAEPVITTISP